ncbi:alcohol oxidase [Rhizodiscina lignyota]|uniref:Alcohol oxidase n=1 Tax=Rhizodiscina lignyota TaxID=1504668 RepID=A0A9P4IC92_9PEZI|nr:alcohol oxidase [Rhizodiscina lignyota]
MFTQGRGPAGATIASRLSRSKTAPSVLLLEAGGPNADPQLRLLAQRFQTFMTPSMSWGYKTEPQAVKNGHNGGVVDYSRGKGLGGSTAVNFACWTVGPKEDYDEWARIVGDDFFNWNHATERRKRFEAYVVPENAEHAKYVEPVKEVHGSSGPVHVEVPSKWAKDVSFSLDAMEEAGLKINKDLNSGDVIGAAICPSTSSNSWRSTAATEFLQDTPKNLTILTDTQATKIIFNGKKATGVEANGKIYSSNKDVIISAGALDTPKLLLLSGVGPEEEITKHNIPMVHSLPGVGRNLGDHPFNFTLLQIRDDLNDLSQLADQAFAEAAKKQFIESGTGAYAQAYGIVIMAFNNATEELLSSPEFKALPPDVQAHICKRNVPVIEWINLAPPVPPAFDQTKTYLPACQVLMSTQSRGTVTLASANPDDAPICDPKIMTHPFDLLNYKLGMKALLKVLRSDAFARNTMSWVLAPRSDSHEDIMDHCAQTIATAWHMSCTAKMGRADDEMSCVDTDFMVRGLEGLRVADMSVTPFVFNCHVQSVAYTIGETAAERLIAEYALDG